MSLSRPHGEADLTDTSSSPSQSPSGQPASPAAAFDPAELLSRIWQQSLPLMRERVACLARASQQAVAGHLTPDARTEAANLAHKLAGSLGMFGFPRGTEIAREMEDLLESDQALDTERFSRLTADLRSVLSL